MRNSASRQRASSAAAPQGAQTVFYHYDPQGRLIAETSGTGAALRTYVWRDDAPLAQIEYVPSRKVLYYELDQLNTPRAAMDEMGKVVWRWESDAFGSTAANEDPDGDGVKTTVNMRFPGQYYDRETGLHYNMARDYDSRIGRYVQSDPIGLEGGINTYAYVRGNPISRIDPLGLSDVTYDRGGSTITIYDNQGNQVGQYPAGNNTTSNSNGPWPNGTYDFSHYMPHPESGADGPYGSNGNFVFSVPGRSGMGIHSGRSGPQSKTQGCIRTTDDATKFLHDLNLTDPLSTITVQ